MVGKMYSLFANGYYRKRKRLGWLSLSSQVSYIVNIKRKFERNVFVMLFKRLIKYLNMDII